MKKINVTFSIPKETHKKLQSIIGQRKMSLFVTKAINKALEQEIEEEMLLLEKEYKEAQKDPARLEVIEDWRKLDSEDWE